MFPLHLGVLHGITPRRNDLSQRFPENDGWATTERLDRTVARSYTECGIKRTIAAGFAAYRCLAIQHTEPRYHNDRGRRARRKTTFSRDGNL